MPTKIPRPWELLPVTSLIYQLRHGHGSLGDRVRMSAAQTLGRYVTNIKEPAGYSLPSGNLEKWPSYAKAVLSDDPSHTWASILSRTGDDSLQVSHRAALYREMFDMEPYPGMDHPGLVKVAPKKYRLEARPDNFDQLPREGKDGISKHSVLGGVHLSATENGSHEFRDTWDIVTADERPGRPSEYDPEGKTLRVRLLISKLLRPAIVEGEVARPDPSTGEYDSTVEPRNVMFAMNKPPFRPHRMNRVSGQQPNLP